MRKGLLDYGGGFVFPDLCSAETSQQRYIGFYTQEFNFRVMSTSSSIMQIWYLLPSPLELFPLLSQHW